MLQELLDPKPHDHVYKSRHLMSLRRNHKFRPPLTPSFNNNNNNNQQQQQQQQQLQQPQPAMNFEQMTQNLAQQSSMFPNAEQFQYEQQPGPNSLSKWTFSVLSQSLIRKISSANNLFL